MMFRPDIDNIEWAIRRSSDHSQGLRAWIDDINDLIEYIRHLEAQRAELLPVAFMGTMYGGPSAYDYGQDRLAELHGRIDAGEFGEVES